jgi:alpha-galactosidase
MGNVWEWGREVGGQSWRTADDLGGSFDAIIDGVYRDGLGLSDRARWSGPGGWNDPDYLLLGYISNGGQIVPTSLTPNEQYTQVSLWCMLAAPLFLSGDITRLDEFTLSLLANDEVLEIDQDALGKAGRRVAADADAETEVWLKELDDGSRAVCLFNRAEGEANIVAQWSDLGVSGQQTVRDLWRQKDLGVLEQRLDARVPRHGVALLRLRSAAQVR